MQFDENMVLETTIGRRNGTPKTFQYKLGDFPANAVEKFLRYGFQRVFNDACGGSDTSHEEKIAEVEGMILRFMDGNVGRVASQGVDPLTHEMRIIARKLFKRGLKVSGKLFADLKDDDDGMKAALDKIIAANAEKPLGDAFPAGEIERQAKAAIKRKVDENRKLSGATSGVEI